MKIVFAASECAPFAKSGGLGDVAQALPKALAKEKGVEVSVFVPYYSKIKYNNDIATEFVTSFYIKLGWRDCYCGIFKLKSRSKKLRYYFIDNEYYFNRDSLYGHFDDGERFAFFSKAVIEASCALGIDPDIYHCNDWQTALVPVILKSEPERFSSVRTVFTIHNIEYQGIAAPDFAQEVLGLPERFNPVLDMNGTTNFMKGAIVTCDKITTVSETYAEEILNPYFAHNLDGILNENRYKLCGIVNGIDTDVFNPATDPAIPVNYSAETIENKAECKRRLQEELGLDQRPEVPVVAMITRLASHKGLELVECVMREILETDLQLVIVGTGEGRFEGMFRTLAYIYPHKVSANICFSTTLASRVYAGCDFLLMPSKSEPCGLSQLIAMRYGALPIVRETGGLKDTVPPVNPMDRTGRGFTFKSYNAYDMLDAIRRAVAFYYDDKAGFEAIRSADMQFDSSWGRSVEKYLALYSSII